MATLSTNYAECGDFLTAGSTIVTKSGDTQPQEDHLKNIDVFEGDRRRGNNKPKRVGPEPQSNDVLKCSMSMDSISPTDTIPPQDHHLKNIDVLEKDDLRGKNGPQYCTSVGTEPQSNDAPKCFICKNSISSTDICEPPRAQTVNYISEEDWWNQVICPTCRSHFSVLFENVEEVEEYNDELFEEVGIAQLDAAIDIFPKEIDEELCEVTDTELHDENIEEVLNNEEFFEDNNIVSNEEVEVSEELHRGYNEEPEENYIEADDIFFEKSNVELEKKFIEEAEEYFIEVNTELEEKFIEEAEEFFEESNRVLEEEFVDETENCCEISNEELEDGFHREVEEIFEESNRVLEEEFVDETENCCEISNEELEDGFHREVEEIFEESNGVLAEHVIENDDVLNETNGELEERFIEEAEEFSDETNGDLTNKFIEETGEFFEESNRGLKEMVIDEAEDFFEVSNINLEEAEDSLEGLNNFEETADLWEIHDELDVLSDESYAGYDEDGFM